MNIKDTLYSKCLEFIENRQNAILKTISEIQESLTTETKSSAGDKHETGRAMLQLEREKAGNQLAETQKINEALSKIDTSQTSKVVRLGSVVYTTQANYYIAISAGEINVNSGKFYAISPLTPIGKLLLGQKVDDEVIFRNQRFSITETF